MTTHASKACCSRPVAVAADYTPTGQYQTLGNKKYYITGPSTAKKAIFFMYDIFGYTPQTIQGADILASQGQEPYLVVVPDLFDGSPAQAEWLARDTDEKKAKFAEFMGRIRDVDTHVENVMSLAKGVREQCDGVEKWGAIGYCWGGKLISLTSGANSPWSAAIETSPARVDPEDAAKVTIPLMMLASKDEPAEPVKAFGEALKTPHHVEIFQQVHGWMSARADLADETVKGEYERGYQMALDFLGEHV